MCNIDADDILNEHSCETSGGLKVGAHYAYYSAIGSPFPKPAENASDFEALATITADFVMKADQYFHKLEADLDAPSLTIESQGNLNNLSASGKYLFRQSGSNKKLVGFLKANLNRPMVFVVEDREGNQRVLGRDGVPAVIESFKEETGQAAGDDKFIEFTVYAPGGIPLFFEGAIPLKP